MVFKIVVIVIVVILFMYFMVFCGGFFVDYERWLEFGVFIGGIVGVLIFFFVFFVLLLMIGFQVKVIKVLWEELELMRKELERISEVVII